MHPALRKCPLFTKKHPHFISCLRACVDLWQSLFLQLCNRLAVDKVSIAAADFLVILKLISYM